MRSLPIGGKLWFTAPSGTVKDMSIIETSKKVDSIVDELFFTTEKDQIETIFSTNSVNDKLDRIMLLRKCMHVLDTSNANEAISLDDEYEDELMIFLSGKWRLLL